MTTPAIDLTRYAWKRELGDVAIFGTWLYNEDQEDTEPCLVLIPRYRTTGFKPVIIALSAAFRYNNPRYLAQVAGTISQSLGFSDDLTTARKIATLIYDHLGDLLNMPVDPTVAQVIGSASVEVGGKKRTVDVLDFAQDR